MSNERKAHICNELLKARDKTMYMRSSEEKLNVFRKYKGRIYNWLSDERGE